MTAMSTCNKCGARYPSAPAGMIHKCHCEGGMMIRDDAHGKIHTDGSRSGGQPVADSIEAKALALVNDVRAELKRQPFGPELCGETFTALCRATEQHEAYKRELGAALRATSAACADHVKTIIKLKQELHDFRQDVSDAVQDYHQAGRPEIYFGFDQFIIPKPKPDPLEEVLMEIDHAAMWVDKCAEEIRASLGARGWEIREKESK